MAAELRGRDLQSVATGHAVEAARVDLLMDHTIAVLLLVVGGAERLQIQRQCSIHMCHYHAEIDWAYC